MAPEEVTFVRISPRSLSLGASAAINTAVSSSLLRRTNQNISLNSKVFYLVWFGFLVFCCQKLLSKSKEESVKLRRDSAMGAMNMGMI